MAKIQREKVIVRANYYNFDERYEEEMKMFEDKEIVSISLILSKTEGDSVREEYLVFYKDLPDEEEDACIERGDLVYYPDVNTGEKIYETVEKVIFDDGLEKCFFVEDSEHGGGFMQLCDVTLVAKKKDRKDLI